MVGEENPRQESPISVTVYVGAAIVSGIIGAIIGSTKNRAVLGFVLGALLGCIGWIIVAVMNRSS